eukprot:scaffold15753_cov48-Attheya_sp.AAC.2
MSETVPPHNPSDEAPRVDSVRIIGQALTTEAQTHMDAAFHLLVISKSNGASNGASNGLYECSCPYPIAQDPTAGE